MVTAPSEQESGKTAILTYATVFEQKEWATGEVQIIHTLLRISQEQEYMDEIAEKRLRQALKNSAMLQDKGIMDGIRSTRKSMNVPLEEWWWWPEKIK